LLSGPHPPLLVARREIIFSVASKLRIYYESSSVKVILVATCSTSQWYCLVLLLMLHKQLYTEHENPIYKERIKLLEDLGFAWSNKPELSKLRGVRLEKSSKTK
jgi:hypothetical protein